MAQQQELTVEQAAQLSRKLLDALKGVMELISNWELVRNISRDDRPDWAVRQMRLVSALLAANRAIVEAESAFGEPGSEDAGPPTS